MRSIFARILLWIAILFVISLASFLLISALLFRRDTPASGFFRRVNTYQVAAARDAWEYGGAPALRHRLDLFDRFFPGRHRLLDARGTDLLTGETIAIPAPEDPPLLPGIFRPNRRPKLSVHSPDGKYILYAAGADPRVEQPNYLPYYLPIVLVIVLGIYVLAYYLGRPLRNLRETVLRFGAGDLEARTGSKRGDEFGDVSRAFDTMADRIQTLLTAERRLLQDISHELRSPLARLSVAVELARTSPDRTAALDRIKKESQRISLLVGELIQMTRAEGDPAERKVAPVDLRALLEELVDDICIEADAKKVQLIRELRCEVTLEGDAELLRRAVENVLRNAIRYSPRDSRVELRLEAGPAEAVVVVRDYGPGVPEEMRDAIFRPFFRVEDDRARQSGGMGLGLAIARRAVHLHHGEITAQNTEPGLEVTIRLPLKA